MNLLDEFAPRVHFSPLRLRRRARSRLATLEKVCGEIRWPTARGSEPLVDKDNV
jgi:hypothetical protein